MLLIVSRSALAHMLLYMSMAEGDLVISFLNAAEHVLLHVSLYDHHQSKYACNSKKTKRTFADYRGNK
jgi:hypothetical protein